MKLSITLFASIFILMASFPQAAQASGTTLAQAQRATCRLDGWAYCLEHEAAYLRQETPRFDAADGLVYLFSKMEQQAAIVIAGARASGSAALNDDADDLENAMDDLESAIQLFDFSNSSGVIVTMVYNHQLSDIIAKSATVRQISGCIRTEIQVIRGGN